MENHQSSSSSYASNLDISLGMSDPLALPPTSEQVAVQQLLLNTFAPPGREQTIEIVEIDDTSSSSSESEEEKVPGDFLRIPAHGRMYTAAKPPPKTKGISKEEKLHQQLKTSKTGHRVAVASLAHARKKVQENESIIENQKKEIERYKKLAEMEHRNARNTFNSQASLIASNKNLRIVLGSAVAVASANFDGCAILGNAMQVASAANPNIVVPLLPRGVMRYPLIRHYLEGTGPLNNQMCFVCLLDFNPGDMVTYRNGDQCHLHACHSHCLATFMGSASGRAGTRCMVCRKDY